MLQIQKFCMENTNWKALLKNKPYCLKIEEKENLVLFKYDQIRSDFSQEICRECRGIILEKNSWKVVRMAFKKFFNYEETHADKIDWNSATATSKEDGSLISLYYYNNEWNIATNGRINSKEANIDSPLYKTYYDLALEAFKLYNVDFNKLNKNYTYTFELCSPFNQIVCKYDKIYLFLICVRDNDTLEEVNEIIENVELPKFYKLNSKEEYEQLIALLGENKEGIVVKDKYNNRVKMKTLLYFQLHRMTGNKNLTLERAVELIMSNDTDEFLSYFPQYTDFIEKLKTIVNNGFNTAENINVVVDNWKKDNAAVARSDFAKFVKNKPFSPLYFIAYDNRNVKEYAKSLEPKKIINLFKIHDLIKED